MATTLMTLLTQPPADAGQEYGSDQVRPKTVETKLDGGDSVSGASRDKPLNHYASLHDVEVDSRPVSAVLSPSAVSKASTSDAGALPPTRVFDGLIKKDDGTYRAVYLRNPLQVLSAGQKAFDDTINGGGSGITVIDGKKVRITDVKPVDAPSGVAAQGDKAVALNPRTVRLSQTSVKDAAEIIDSMRANGWAGLPIDVVRMPDGGLTTIDNTRVVASGHAGIDLQAVIHPFDEPLPDQTQIDRFTTRKGVPSTWGDAISLRIGKQAAAYRNRYPMGSPWTGWDGN
ncbi:hypothetical protein AB0K57_32550 [Streptomyces halstedii]|uniref:hypothetical protein n=1 Tax=Streptomyces halstedii TaxID=1944 RepID=UPI00346107CA